MQVYPNNDHVYYEIILAIGSIQLHVLIPATIYTHFLSIERINVYKNENFFF